MSLRDEMLKAGLITEEQAKRGAHQQRQENKREAKHTDKRQRQAQHEAKQQEARQRQDAEREQQRAEARARQAVQDQREQALQEGQRQASALSTAYREGVPAKWEGARRYYYAAHGRVEVLMVSDDVGRKLESGQAAIVAAERNPQRHVPMLSGAARRLRELDPARILVWHEGPPPRSRA